MQQNATKCKEESNPFRNSPGAVHFYAGQDLKPFQFLWGNYSLWNLICHATRCTFRTTIQVLTGTKSTNKTVTCCGMKSATEKLVVIFYTLPAVPPAVVLVRPLLLPVRFRYHSPARPPWLPKCRNNECVFKKLCGFSLLFLLLF